MGVLNEQTKPFVYQNAGQILKKQPGYLGDLARSITNLGAIINQTLQGGRKGGKRDSKGALAAGIRNKRANLESQLRRYAAFRASHAGKHGKISTSTKLNTFVNLDDSATHTLIDINKKIMEAYHELLEDGGISDDEKQIMNKILTYMRDSKMLEVGGQNTIRGLGFTSSLWHAKRSLSNAVSKTANAIWRQVSNKDSLTRKHLVPIAKDLARVAQPFLDVYAPGSGTAIKAVADSISCASNLAKSVGYGKNPRHQRMETYATELNSLLRKYLKLRVKLFNGDESMIPLMEQMRLRWRYIKERLFTLAEYPQSITEGTEDENTDDISEYSITPVPEEVDVSESESESDSEPEPDADAVRRGRGQLHRRIRKAMTSELQSYMN
jgi:hypothetical protein